MVLLIILALLIAGYLYLFQPHITFEEVRVSNQPGNVTAVFVNVTGDPLCAKLYKLDHMDNHKPVASKDPLFIALPNLAPSPVRGNLGYADNIYSLKGYNYQYVTRNRLAGTTKTRPSHRFDVIKWEIVTPYKKWKDSGPEGKTMAKAVISSESVAYEFNSTDHSRNQFVSDNYVDCLSG